LTMMKYGIEDIRLMYQGDLKLHDAIYIDNTTEN